MREIGGLAIAASLALLFSSEALANSLLEPPPHSVIAEPLPLPKTESVAVLTAFAPYASIRAIGDAEIPASISFVGDGSIACMDLPRVVGGHAGHHTECRNVLGKKVCIDVPDFTAPHLETTKACADYHWDAILTKDGPLGAEQSGEAVRLRLPLHVTGHAGVKGDLAGILSLNGNSIDARLAPAADVKLDMGTDWCPVVKASASGRWVESASVEIVGKNCLSLPLGSFGHKDLCAGPVNLGLADVLNKTLDAHRGDMERKAAEAIRCDDVKSRITSIWRPIAIKIPMGDALPLYLNVVPRNAAFSGLIAGSDGVRLTVRLNAATSVGVQPPSSEPLPLPPLERIAVGDDGVRVSVGLDTPYELIRQQLGAHLTGREFSRSTPLGDVTVNVEEVDVYASGDSVALGLRVDAQGPTGMLDAKGWVYLSGKPVVAGDGTVLAITDLKYSAVLDNLFWKYSQPLFENEILSELGARARFDLSSKIAELSARIAAAVAGAGAKGLTLSASDTKIALTAVQVAPTRLFATATFSMKLDATLTGTLLGK